LLLCKVPAMSQHNASHQVNGSMVGMLSGCAVAAA
jgi:hypothetical protein